MTARPAVDVVVANSRIEKPAYFQTHGTTEPVLTAWGEALQKELHTDIEVKVADIGVGSQSGCIGLKSQGNARFGVTRFAWTQLFQRAGKGAPAGAAAEFAWWARPAAACHAWTEIRDRGHGDKTLIARIASDIHHNGDGQRYARAFISERHSGAEADDLALLRNLIEPLTDRSDPRFGGLFTDGAANVYRDPSNFTRAWFSSSTKICQKVDARLSISVTNSEVGRHSLGHGLYVTFMAGENQAHVALPVSDASGSSRHVGSAAVREVRKLGENTMKSIAWAPSLAQLLKTDPTTQRLSMPLADFFLPLMDDKGRTTDDDKRARLVEATRNAYAITADESSALFEVVLLAFLKLEERATRIIEGMCGRIR